jgi:N-acyl-D-aspartate/D-glutamate deacylase
MLAHDSTIVGLGDGGAHVGILSDASALSTMLTLWTRDRRGPRFPLPWAVRRITHDSAAAMGLHDRGLVRAGLKADLNVIDHDRLSVRAPEVVYDLPAGGRRLIQRADGYDATIVSGTIVSRNGVATGALPGRLIRGGRPAS